MVGGRLIAGVLKRCLRPGAERTAERAGIVLVFYGVPEGVWGGPGMLRGRGSGYSRKYNLNRAFWSSCFSYAANSGLGLSANGRQREAKGELRSD